MKTNLDHLPPVKQHELARVVEIILEEFEDAPKGASAEFKKRGTLYVAKFYHEEAMNNMIENSHEETPDQLFGAVSFGGGGGGGGDQASGDGGEGNEGNEGNENNEGGEGGYNNEGNESNEGDEGNERNEGDEGNEGSENGNEGNEGNETGVIT